VRGTITKVALITGIAGQDGSYLAELLLEKGYAVHGIVRRVALENQTHKLWRINHLLEKIKLHSVSLENYQDIFNIIQLIKPEEVYHLAAQSYVSYLFKDECSTLNTNINSTHYVLSVIKEFSKNTKFYFAGSQEMFGKVKHSPQNENTSFYPRSAYGISKVAGFDLTRYFREAYDLHASSGILYTHESPRRGVEFVTRKITQAVAKIKNGLQKDLRLGNIQAKRDWGHAKDYVEAMWLMLQQDSPDDYVVGTGIAYSVEEFAKIAFSVLDLNYEKYIKIDKNLYRPSAAVNMISDSSKIRNKLQWKSKTNLESLVSEMVISDYNKLK